MKPRVMIQDPFVLLANSRWIGDYFDIVEPDRGEGHREANDFVVLPWNSPQAKEIYPRHRMRRSDHGFMVDYENATGLDQFDTTKTLCLLIDREPGESWRFVMFCPLFVQKQGILLKLPIYRRCIHPSLL